MEIKRLRAIFDAVEAKVRADMKEVGNSDHYAQFVVDNMYLAGSESGFPEGDRPIICTGPGEDNLYWIDDEGKLCIEERSSLDEDLRAELGDEAYEEYITTVDPESIAGDMWEEYKLLNS